MYLRNEYATITEYNEQAGSVAEKYHFLVIAGLPAGFSESAMARLKSILASGPRCGVFTLVHWDRRQNLPEGLSAEDLRKFTVRLVREKGVVSFGGISTLQLDPFVSDEIAASLAHQIGQASIDSNRVQVPFSVVAPKEMWSESTTNELRIAIGRTGATKLQMLAIGKGTKQHALLAGKTGSGKSTLLHIIITNLALTCSPDEIEFYLIDFKKGVEFKCYADAKLPHAKVIAIESDREFALSVLQRIDEELKRRGELYRKLGAQDLAGYKRAGGTEPMPRSMLIIDEFQEFFVEDDSVAQGAALLLDRIVRQGRAFGIHVFLGSQTLGGAYTLARTTLGQMVIRIALQCNEADAALIMDEGNVAARMLSRPGEGIYNDAAGALEGNSPFQVVWLTDEERDENLAKVAALAQTRGFGKKRPIVFEGNMPADVRDNPLLAAALENPPAKAPADPRVWLGLPNAIKGPTDAMFPRQSGRHLLLVGQNDEAIAAILGLAMIGFAAQHPRDKAPVFYLIHGALTETPEFDFLEAAAAKAHAKVTQGHEAPDFIAEVHAEMKRRSDEGSAGDPPIFLLVSAFLINMTLSRMIALEREQIGLLKALGYGQASIAMHYVKLVLLITCVGIILGFLAGTWIGEGLTRLYQQFFHFPFLIFSHDADTYAIAALVTAAAAVAGALKAVWTVLQLAPAVAMQPPAPPRYRASGSWTWLVAGLSQLSVMSLRHMARKPVRAATTCLGIAMSVALLVTAWLSFDSIDLMIDVAFFRTDRQHATLTFTQEKGPDALQAVARLPGVVRAEPFRSVYVEIANGAARRQLSIIGKPSNMDLSRVLDRNFDPIKLPPEGLVVNERVAEILKITRGDLVEVKILEGRRETRFVPVADVIKGYFGLTAFMDIAALDALMYGPRLTGVHIAYDFARQGELFAAIKSTPTVGSIGLQRNALKRFRETLAQNITYSVTVYVTLAVVIAFGVVYNSARIQLSEHARELASLRVLGFTKAEVSRVLLTELAILTLIAMPLGWLLGYGFGWLLIQAFSSDLYRVPFTIARATYAKASLVVLVAAAASALIVRRRVDTLDLIAVLKTRD